MGNMLCHFRHMLLNITHKCRAAGRSQEALFRQFLCFLLGNHICAQCCFHHIMEAQIAQCLLYLSERCILKLRCNCRCDDCHGIITAVVRLLNQIDRINNIRIINNCAKRALAHAGTTVDTLIIINFCLLLIVHLNGTDLAGTLTGTDIFRDGAIGTCLCTASAMDALIGINFRLAILTLGDGALGAGLHAAMCQTAAAGIADGIPVNRAFITGNINDLNDIAAALTAQYIMYTLTDNGTFLIYTAAHRWFLSRNNLLRYRIIYIVHFLIQSMLRNRTQHLIFEQLDVSFKISHGRFSLSQKK